LTDSLERIKTSTTELKQKCNQLKHSHTVARNLHIVLTPANLT